MLSSVLAVVDPTLEAVPQISNTLELAGPYALAAILIVGMVALWRKLCLREDKQEEMAKQLLEAYNQQTRTMVEFTEAMRRNTQLLEKIGDRIMEVR